MQQQQPNQPATDSTAQAATTNRPVQTVRSGAIGGSVWQNDNDKVGITLSRSWKSADGDTGHSKTFFAGNRDDLHRVIDQACDVAQALERAVERRVVQLGSQVEAQHEQQ